MKGAKDALGVLSRPGPHEVRHGDLGLVGIPGIIYTPVAGLGLPAVVLAHDWLQPVRRYVELLRHLASWGIVAAAPDTQGSPVPSISRFSTDLLTTLDVCVGVRLGDGRISVDSRRTALAGHGIGGGTALLAASRRERLGAVVTLAPAEVRPSAIEAARSVTAPTLHLAAEVDSMAPAAGHAQKMAEAAGGPVQLRTLAKAGHLGFCEGLHWTGMLTGDKAQPKVRKLTRALVTAYLLDQLMDESRVRSLTEGDVKGAPLVDLTAEEDEEAAAERRDPLKILGPA
ncbi:dienelactone hydrolase family protein [Pseudonocardia endophytica]|uniref:Dienelactone hydrolase n=1 Tax=Pseudonocardia endophytica TaxID=401976 RepID=A0A4V2PHE1_PSEEN|nr:dienelactone hydrolase family protein [Pseudonocardia endophytica]TCK20376.1 dienelactone hydrolase [Pseudonocardia endophytica]